jgi:molybdopterin converting factor small subunit
MQVHVALYGGARVVSGKSVVDLSFDASTVTLAQMLEKLIASYPLARPYLLDAEGMLQTSIRVLINKERPEPDATLATVLRDEDRVTLLMAVAGGTHTCPIAKATRLTSPGLRCREDPDSILLLVLL